MDNAPTIPLYEEDTDTDMVDITENLSTEEIDNMRSEMREGNSRIIERTSVDAMSGTKVSVPDDNKLDEIENHFVKMSIRGKSIPMDIIKHIDRSMGVELSEDDCERMAKAFDEYGDDSESKDIHRIEYDDVKYILGNELIKVIEAVGSDSAEATARRVLKQIYDSYKHEVTYCDYMTELVEIVRKAKKVTAKSNELKAREENGENVDQQSLNNLIQAREWISRYLEVKSKLDNREKLRHDYSIDDYETHALDGIHQCLEDTLDMSIIKNYLKENPGVANAYPSAKNAKIIIKHWVKKLKNDPDVIYTLPVNDDLSSERTVDVIVEFLYNGLTINRFPDTPIVALNGEYSNAAEYYISAGLLTHKDSNILKEQSLMVWWLLTKVFSEKRLKSDTSYMQYYKRSLSYILDMISKIHDRNYYRIINELAMNIYKFIKK